MKTILLIISLIPALTLAESNSDWFNRQQDYYQRQQELQREQMYQNQQLFNQRQMIDNQERMILQQQYQQQPNYYIRPVQPIYYPHY